LNLRCEQELNELAGAGDILNRPHRCHPIADRCVGLCRRRVQDTDLGIGKGIGSIHDADLGFPFGNEIENGA
jgi:hypothetical protein